MRNCSEKEVWKRRIIIIALIYMVAISAIIRSNFIYKDDLGRIMQGYQRWSFASRYLSDMISTVLVTGRYMTDISPLTQILAVCCMACGAVILIKVFADGREAGWMSLVAVIPFALNPYFLECLTFKFDSAFMAVSVVCSVVPILFLPEEFDKKQVLRYGLCSCLGILCTCLTYQVSTSVYPILVITLAVDKWSRKKKDVDWCLKFVVLSVICFMSALLIYKFVFVHAVPAYVDDSMLPIKELIPGMWQHYQMFYDHVFQDFRSLWKVCLGMFTVLYIVHHVVYSQRKKVAAFIVWVLALLLESACVHGVYIVMTDSSFRPRSMYGIGIMISVMMLTISFDRGWKTVAIKGITAIICWSFFVYCFTFGNDLRMTKEHMQTRVQAIVDDLDDLQLVNNGVNYTFAFEGGISAPRVVKNQFAGCYLTKRLIPRVGEVGWGPYYFSQYFGIKNMTLDVNVKAMDLPVVKSSGFYTIYADDSHILISFKKIHKH